MADRPPLPPSLKAATWTVVVYDPPAEGREWTSNELNDLADKYGFGTDAYDEAIGPVDGFRDSRTYGPYTEQQADEVAAFIRESEPACTVLTPRLFRYTPPVPAVDGGKHSGGSLGE